MMVRQNPNPHRMAGFVWLQESVQAAFRFLEYRAGEVVGAGRGQLQQFKEGVGNQAEVFVEQFVAFHAGILPELQLPFHWSGCRLPAGLPACVFNVVDSLFYPGQD